MKTLLLPILIGCGTLLPATSLHAGGPASKKWGGFSKGYTFTLTVTDRDCTRTEGLDEDDDAPIPGKFPNFKVGQKITFKILDKGKLQGPGFAIKYREDDDNRVLYSNGVVGPGDRAEAAIVTKNDKDKARKVRLTFAKYGRDDLEPTSTVLVYKLERK